MHKKILFLVLVILFSCLSFLFFSNLFLNIGYSNVFFRTYGMYAVVPLIPIFSFFENYLVWRHVNVIHNGQILAPVSLGVIMGLVLS